MNHRENESATSRITGSIRHLGVVPCGACSALVLASSGCAHWKPLRTGRYSGQHRTDGSLTEYGRKLIARIGSSPEGQIDCQGDKSLSTGLYRLSRNGYTERIVEGSLIYKLTDSGNKVLDEMKKEGRINDA